MKGFDIPPDEELVRKRPRNPNEKKWLQKWEDERGGQKIGKI